MYVHVSFLYVLQHASWIYVLENGLNQIALFILNMDNRILKIIVIWNPILFLN